MILADLKNKHAGQDIYVLGSGASLGYIDSKFFDNKIVVCTNFTIDYVNKCSGLYLVAKEPTFEMQESARKRGALIVTCEKHSGVPTNEPNQLLYPDHTIIFTPGTGVVKDKEQVTALERSSSSIVSSIHLAAFMGAKYIILVGHDCGSLDKAVHIKGYNNSSAVTKLPNYSRWMRGCKVQKKTLEVKSVLKKVHGIEVYSLNPFINFGLEGHKYREF